MAPWFSIVMPVYNAKGYLERGVRSVLSQDFQDYEIVLVNDGSTDGSGELCDTLAAEHACIRVIHKENGGLADARNTGLAEACGRYIWWVDADDWISPGSLSRLYAESEKAQPDMVKFNHFRVENGGTACVRSCASPGCYEKEACRELLNQALRTGGKFLLSACFHIYRREFLTKKNLLFVSERLVGSEDYLFNLECYLYAERITVITEALYSYELRMGSLTQSYKKDLPQRYERLYGLLQEKYQAAGAWEAYSGDIAGFYLRHLLHGTCIPSEYFDAPEHTMENGRENIRAFLSFDSVRQAYLCCDKSRFSVKSRIQLWAMKMGWEWLFYWLYVKKPKWKKGIFHENKTKVT